jgi:hypothetical protein
LLTAVMPLTLAMEAGVMFAVVTVVLMSAVVAGVGARDTDAGHIYRLADTRILVGEDG